MINVSKLNKVQMDLKWLPATQYLNSSTNVAVYTREREHQKKSLFSKLVKFPCVFLFFFFTPEISSVGGRGNHKEENTCTDTGV